MEPIILDSGWSLLNWPVGGAYYTGQWVEPIILASGWSLLYWTVGGTWCQELGEYGEWDQICDGIQASDVGAECYDRR